MQSRGLLTYFAMCTGLQRRAIRYTAVAQSWNSMLSGDLLDRRVLSDTTSCAATCCTRRHALMKCSTSIRGLDGHNHDHYIGANTSPVLSTAARIDGGHPEKISAIPSPTLKIDSVKILAFQSVAKPRACLLGMATGDKRSLVPRLTNLPVFSFPQEDIPRAVAQSAAIIAEYQVNRIDNYVLYSATALACHEYLITFKYEHTLLWQQKWTSATWLVLANRFLTLAIAIERIASFNLHVRRSASSRVAMNIYSCSIYGRAHLSLLKAPPNDLNLISRCYNFPLMIFLFVLQGLPVIIAAVFSDTRSSLRSVSHSFPGSSFRVSDECFFSAYPFADASAAAVVAFTFCKTPAFLGDATVTDTTRCQSSARSQSGPIALGGCDADGHAFSQPAFETANPVTGFTAIVQPILISRFLINLRQLKEPSNRAAVNSHFSQFSVVNFSVPTIQTIVGNMGEPLQHGDVAQWGTDSEETAAPSHSSHALPVESA
ncbi:hypothetical protein NM688_g7208 [Phlebia brevispora]|uniref:Uncharacterized protein n=1 Tax=Phlebia brevispora TaxID=194682 RepID=A0ACC1S7Z6_9APHY|nr:hypothetical protein NM688_g7208 [Phlebia brevispora]